MTPLAVSRAPSGFEPWARVTGDVARGYVSLLGGPRGTGKTRLMMRVALGVIRALSRCHCDDPDCRVPDLGRRCALSQGRPYRPVIYQAIDAQDADELRMVCEQVGYTAADLDHLYLVDDPDLEQLEELAGELHPALIVTDALANLELHGLPCLAGSATERACAPRLRRLASSADAALVAMLHMQANQANYSIGRPMLQGSHLIARVDPSELVPEAIALRVDGKNRFGPAHLSALLRFDARGALETHPQEVRS